MDNPLSLRIEAFTRLSREDKAALNQLAARSVREIDARRDIIREGEPPRYVRLILDGWACRYKMLPDARRQIVSLFLPGDFCDLNVYILKEMDHNIGALTRVRFSEIGREAMDAVTTTHPRITQALWWHELVAMAVQREWTLNVGQRTAIERIAHLFVELFLRLKAVGLTRRDSCDFPMTQTDIAEATGLTAVHVNRTLQQLRRDGLIQLERKELTILDLDRLKDVAMFNPNYLHLNREGRHLDAND